MSDTHTKKPATELENFFGPVVHTYTRAQALADGVLVDVSETAREAGFKIPVAVTAEVWESCIAWSDEDTAKQTYQDLQGRLWDVLCMARFGIYVVGDKRATEIPCSLNCIPKDGRSRGAKRTQLKVVISGGDDGEAVITIMLPSQD